MPDRIEREIDEILKNIDDFPARRQTPRRIPGRFSRRVSALQRSIATRLVRISVGQLLVASLCVMLFSWLFKAALGKHWIYALAFGLILFFTTFVLSFRNGTSHQTYYRDRPRSYYRADQPLSTRLRTWGNQKRRR
jgi:Na+/melibiose symporter-like transporter